MNSSALTNTVTSTLFWCHSGTAIVNAPDRIISVLAGDLVIAPAGAFITSSGAAGHDRGATGVVIPISFPGMKITGATRRMHLGQVWSDRMISEYSRSMLGESELSADIMKLFDDRAKPPKMPTAPAALAVAKQLQANPADPTSLIDFAKRQHVSSRTLQRQFQATTDYTFSEWRAAYRVSVAADLLSHQFTITNVASMVGFDATSSLTRAFKRHTGTTPSSFTTGAVGMGGSSANTPVDDVCSGRNRPGAVDLPGHGHRHHRRLLPIHGCGRNRHHSRRDRHPPRHRSRLHCAAGTGQL